MDGRSEEQWWRERADNWGWEGKSEPGGERRKGNGGELRETAKRRL